MTRCLPFIAPEMSGSHDRSRQAVRNLHGDAKSATAILASRSSNPVISPIFLKMGLQIACASSEMLPPQRMTIAKSMAFSATQSSRTPSPQVCHAHRATTVRLPAPDKPMAVNP
jgi:hypothetical protein